MTGGHDATGAALADLGWNAFFAGQVSGDEHIDCVPARVMSVHRGRVTIAGAGIEESIDSGARRQGGPDDRPTVGDWLLVDRATATLTRILDRKSLFKRPDPGNERRSQLIAANIDTLFIVSACDQDFNVARIERYLVGARAAGARPVVVLTKADLASAPDQLVEATRALEVDLPVELVDGRDPARITRLASYCGRGATVALVGSSGVGKSTLINTLRGSDSIETQSVREEDGKGRHTTTVRQMHRLMTGADVGWLIDTPGMRELQMADVEAGVDEVFDDVTDLVRQCRFSNCAHADEPGCAVRAAMADGALDPARVARWRKLLEESAASNEVAAGRRSRGGRSGSRR